LLTLEDRKAIRLALARYGETRGRDADLSRQQCAVGTARNDAANPRPVIVSIGAVAEDISLSEAARPPIDARHRLALCSEARLGESNPRGVRVRVFDTNPLYVSPPFHVRRASLAAL
jgi:hypothetical protein